MFYLNCEQSPLSLSLALTRSALIDSFANSMNYRLIVHSNYYCRHVINAAIIFIGFFLPAHNVWYKYNLFNRLKDGPLIPQPLFISFIHAPAWRWHTAICSGAIPVIIEHLASYNGACDIQLGINSETDLPDIGFNRAAWCQFHTYLSGWIMSRCTLL